MTMRVISRYVVGNEEDGGGMGKGKGKGKYFGIRLMNVLNLNELCRKNRVYVCSQHSLQRQMIDRSC